MNTTFRRATLAAVLLPVLWLAARGGAASKLSLLIAVPDNRDRSRSVLAAGKRIWRSEWSTSGKVRHHPDCRYPGLPDQPISASRGCSYQSGQHQYFTQQKG